LKADFFKRKGGATGPPNLSSKHSGIASQRNVGSQSTLYNLKKYVVPSSSEEDKLRNLREFKEKIEGIMELRKKRRYSRERAKT
jgi:hypothetical protein